MSSSKLDELSKELKLLEAEQKEHMEKVAASIISKIQSSFDELKVEISIYKDNSLGKKPIEPESPKILVKREQSKYRGWYPENFDPELWKLSLTK